jgi:hypothetical protein
MYRRRIGALIAGSSLVALVIFSTPAGGWDWIAIGSGAGIGVGLLLRRDASPVSVVLSSLGGALLAPAVIAFDARGVRPLLVWTAGSLAGGALLGVGALCTLYGVYGSVGKRGRQSLPVDV